MSILLWLAVLLGPSAGEAHAVGALAFGGCVSNDQSDVCEDADDEGGGEEEDSQLLGAASVVASPDGENVYSLAPAGDQIAIYNRSEDGDIQYAGCMGNTDGFGNCARAEVTKCAISGGVENCRVFGFAPLDRPIAMAFSPDGRYLYVLSFSSPSATVSTFERLPGGELVLRDCIHDSSSDGCRPLEKIPFGPWVDVNCVKASTAKVGCRPIPGISLIGLSSLAISPDGKSAYVGAGSVGAITTFKRGAKGRLVYAECLSDHPQLSCRAVGGAQVSPLNGLSALAVSPDGASLYATAYWAGTVSVFERLAGGRLVFGSCFSNAGSSACKDMPGPGSPLQGARSVAISPDGSSVYVGAFDSGTITRFSKRSSAELEYASCLSNTGSGGCTVADPSGGNPLTQLSHLALSNDGESLYVAAHPDSTDGVISFFSRHSDGELSYSGCVSDDDYQERCQVPVADADVLGGVNSVAVSPDDRSVYTAAGTDEVVTHFLRKVAPDTEIASGPEDGSLSADSHPSFSFWSDQPEAMYECSLDGGPFNPCAESTRIGPVGDGAHRLLVRAVAAGDRDPTPANTGFAVDTTGPTATIQKLQPRKKKSRSRKRKAEPLRFAFTAGEPESEFQCRFDGKAFGPCESTVSFKPRRGKRHRLEVKALDELGNVGPVATLTFRGIAKKRRRGKA